MKTLDFFLSFSFFSYVSVSVALWYFLFKILFNQTFILVVKKNHISNQFDSVIEYHPIFVKFFPYMDSYYILISINNNNN